MKRFLCIASLCLAVTVVQAQTAVQAWVQRHNGSGYTNDLATAIALDTNGNVIVTGYSDDGSFGLGTDKNFTTIKYSSAGAPLWTNRHFGPGSFSYGPALAVNRECDVFVAASAYDGSGSSDYATIKYSGAGVPLWTNRYNGPGSSSDQARAIALDTNGNVFVTGYSVASGGIVGYATVAYSGTGVALWTNRYNGSGNLDDRANAVAVDASGNVFVTGYSYDTNGDYDFATIAYSNTGVPLWTNRYNGPGNSMDLATAMAVDCNGQVFVTGYSYSGSDNNTADYATLAYSSAGVPLWTNRYDGTGNGSDHPSAVAVDGSGNVFVTGSSWGNGSAEDYATIKYSGAGEPLWTNRYNGPGNYIDTASAVAVDGSGYVVVTGSSIGAGGGARDYTTIGYSSEGLALWTNRYNGPANGDDIAIAMTVDGSGNLFVTGASQSNIGNGTYDYATIKYSIVHPTSLSIQRMGDQAVLSWTNAAFGLESAPASNGSFTNVPSAASPYTNPITGSQQFFRLRLN